MNGTGTIKKQDGQLSIWVRFENCVGRYWTWVYDAQGNNPVLIQQGTSKDGPKPLPGPADAYANRTLYTAAEAASVASTTVLVGVEVRLTQPGVDVCTLHDTDALPPGKQEEFPSTIDLT
jgi:hypothetical protein